MLTWLIPTKTVKTDTPLDVTFIYEKFNLRVWNYICRRISDDEDRQELMQEVFLKLLKTDKKFYTEDYALKWLYDATRTTVIDFYKKNNKYLSVFSSLLDDPNAPQSITSTLDNEPSEVYLKKELAFTMLQFIHELKPIYYEVLKLNIFKEYSPKQIAKILNISVFTVYSRLERGKELLKDKMNNDYL